MPARAQLSQPYALSAPGHAGCQEGVVLSLLRRAAAPSDASLPAGRGSPTSPSPWAPAPASGSSLLR